MITVNIDKAKEIGHSIRREKRAEEFKPLDEAISKQIPNSGVASGGKYSGGNDGNNSVAVGSATTPPATTSCQIANFTSTIGTTDNPNIFFAAFR